MTDDLARRVEAPGSGAVPGFTSRHGATRLVGPEPHPTREDAFLRERQLKTWSRAWKTALIERDNPGWRDLSADRLRCGGWIPRFRGDERRAARPRHGL